MTHLNHSRSRPDLSDAVVAAYIHDISARQVRATADRRRRGDRPQPSPQRLGAGRSRRARRRLPELVADGSAT